VPLNRLYQRRSARHPGCQRCPWAAA
jgi:hypothetical protein